MALTVLGALTTACGSSTDQDQPDVPVVPGDGASSFVSHVAGQSVNFGPGGAADGRAAGAGGSSNTAAPAAEPDAARTIAEADIIQVEGDRLYALSRYAGMTIIDVSNPRDLRVVGSHRSASTPFEMYLKDGTAYLMLNGYYTSEFDESVGHTVWRSTARMQALDVSDPANIRTIGDIAVPGEISDSRMVGDVVYLVTYQDSYCYQCESVENTRITSFDVSNPAAFTQIDDLRFESPQGSWGRRSISVTPERMYVGGPHWDWSTQVDQRGTIQVVDIADPSGDLKLGSEVSIAGSIDNRWQMDEHEGVLRVVSQVGGWGNGAPPEVETFRVESATSVSPLGRITMVLPRPEELQSVRFDGLRGYAVTFERTDPLFTLDLSDPANPRQMGELEIPGFLYHMEPRGDRLYGLGFDDAAEGRGLTVSIFDVSDMTAPTMLDRVVFGGTWASLSEDQDRIHKAFNLLLDQGLILVPFSGNQADEANCNYDWQSGIQLIDVIGDDLVLRGVAPQIGEARRSLLHESTLFGVSDNAIQAFDITNRDAPSALDKLEVARNVESVHVMGDHVLRFGQDWYTGRTLLDFTTTDDAGSAEPIGELDLSELFAQEENLCTESSYWSGQVYVHGDMAYVPRQTHRWDNLGERSTQVMTIYVVSLANRAAPRIAGSFELEPAVSYSAANGYESESIGDVLLTDSALLVGRSKSSYRYDMVEGDADETTNRYFYDVFSLENPAAPRFTKRFEVPAAIASHGWGYGPMGCGLDMRWGWWFPGSGTSALVSGDIVASNHSVPLDDGTDRVRYYLDRLDVSDPGNPRLLPEVNIPGQVTHFDAARGFLLTVEDGFETVAASSWEDCTWRSSRAMFDDTTKQCRLYDRLLNALVLEGNVARRVSRVDLDGEFVSGNVAFSTDRVFVARSEAGPYQYDAVNPTPRRREVISFLIHDNGQLGRLPGVSLGKDTGYGWWPELVARGTRAFVTNANEMTVIDTSVPSAPSLKTHEMPGYYCSSLQVSGDKAYCAMNQYGVTAFDL